MRYKLKKQRLAAPASFLFGVVGGFAVDSAVFNSRYFGRRIYMAALPGLAFAAIGGYVAYDLDQAVDRVKERQLLQFADQRQVFRAVSVACLQSNWTSGNIPTRNEV